MRAPEPADANRSATRSWSHIQVWLLAGAAVVGMPGALCLMSPVLPLRMRYSGFIADTERVLAEVEAFRRVHGRYPNAHEYTPAQSWITYAPSYRICFSAGFDENFCWYFHSRRWDFDERARR